MSVAIDVLLSGSKKAEVRLVNVKTEEHILSQIEVTAEVFRIIRGYDGRSAGRLWQIIQQVLEDVPVEMLKEAIRQLKEKADIDIWR